MRIRLTLFAALALTACDRAGQKQAAPEPASKAEPTADAREVAAADAFGEPADEVKAVAFWSHPKVAFESLILAATSTGVHAYNFETGEAVAHADDKADDLAVVYMKPAGAADASGYVIASAFPGYQIYSIDAQSRALTARATTMGAPGVRRFCAGSSKDRATIYEIGAEALSARDVLIADKSIEIGDPRPLATVSKLIDCEVDEQSGAIIAISSDGAIRRVDAATGETYGLALPSGLAAAGAALAVNRAPESENAAGQIALLDAKTGVINLFDLMDGHALGAVKVKATFDLDAVSRASVIAIGSANYGGVYRDGAMAVVATGSNEDLVGPIRLVPWNGVMDALDQTLGAPFDPFSRFHVAAEEPGLLIDVKLP